MMTRLNVGLTLILLFLLGNSFVSADVLLDFDEGKTVTTGTDVHVTLPKGSSVDGASLVVNTNPLKGPFKIRDFVLDVNSDGTPEYAFSGTGYGRLGFQDEFADGSRFLNASVPSGGETYNQSILLPESMVIDFIPNEMKIEITPGHLLAVPEGYKTFTKTMMAAYETMSRSFSVLGALNFSFKRSFSLLPATFAK